MKKIKDYIKEHEKEIVIAAVAGIVGMVGGIICHKGVVSKKYGELIKAIDYFGESAAGVSMADDTVTFLKEATHSVQVLRPNYVQTIKTTFGDGTGSKYLVERGLDPNTVVTGVLVGIKKAET